MKKSIEISLEKAKELYKNGGEDMKSLILENFTESELSDRVTKWEDLKNIEGCYIDDDSNIRQAYSNARIDNKNVWATKEQAEACLAMSQLSQLMKRVNGDWVPDWGGDKSKYVIEYYYGKINTCDYFCHNKFLAFPTRDIRDQFLEDHRELIEQAKPLL